MISSANTGFEIQDLGDKCTAIHHLGRTVALVSSQGWVDWLLRTPNDKGERFTSMKKEPHLGYILGVKINLDMPGMTNLQSYSGKVQKGAVVLTAPAKSPDGNFESRTTATLHVDEKTRRYAWRMKTVLKCVAKAPVTLTWLEYNNVLPDKTGLCLLWSATKETRHTLMSDRDGTIWRCPHQHPMGYGHKINAMRFADGSTAGFFAPGLEAPVVTVDHSTLEPHWGICDMYYDLHCCARPVAPIQPGQEHVFEYHVHILDRPSAQAMLDRSQPVPVTPEDRKHHDYPRVDLGTNRFTQPVPLDRADECGTFRTDPPRLVWQRPADGQTSGALQITHDQPRETIWRMSPPMPIPPGKSLQLRARVKTRDVIGKGLSLRVPYYVFLWRPTAHIEYPLTLNSPSVNGTTDGWVEIAVPKLDVPQEHFDYLVDIMIVLDGQGAAWLTDLEVDLK